MSRQIGTFQSGEARGAAALVVKFVPNLAEPQFKDAVAQIDQLSAVSGVHVVVPQYDVSAVGGLGDAAIFVKSELLDNYFKDSLIVARGDDAYAFDADDSPTAAAQLSALARAVLANNGP